MSAPSSAQPRKNSSFNYGNPLRTSTFNSDTQNDSFIESRPLSTTEYKRFQPIAQAYSLPVPAVRLNVIKSAAKKKPKLKLKQVAPIANETENEMEKEPDSDKMVVKVPNSVRDDDTVPPARENSVTDIFADLIRPQKTGIDLKKKNENQYELNPIESIEFENETQREQEAQSVKNTEKRKTYRQRKQELLNMKPEAEIIQEEKPNEPKDPSKAKKEKIKKAKKRTKSLDKTTSQQSLDNAEESGKPDANESLAFNDESSFNPKKSLFSLSFDAASPEYSKQIDEDTLKETEEVPAFEISQKESEIIQEEKPPVKDSSKIKKVKKGKLTKVKKRSKSLAKAESQQSLISLDEDFLPDANKSLIVKDETSFTIPKPSVSSLSFNANSARYSYQIDENSLKQNEDAPIFELTPKESSDDKGEQNNESETKLDQPIEDNTKIENNEQQPNDAMPKTTIEEVNELNEAHEKPAGEESPKKKPKNKESKKKKIKSKKAPPLVRSDSIASRTSMNSGLKKKSSRPNSKDPENSRKSYQTESSVFEIDETIKVTTIKFKTAAGKAKSLASSTEVSNEKEIPADENTNEAESVSAQPVQMVESNEPSEPNESAVPMELAVPVESAEPIEPPLENLDKLETTSLSPEAPSPPPPSEINNTVPVELEHPQLPEETDDHLFNKDSETIVKTDKIHDKKMMCKKNECCALVTGACLIFLAILLIIILVVTLKSTKIAREAYIFNATLNVTLNSTTSTSTTTTTTSTTSTTTALTCISTTTLSPTQLVSQSYTCPTSTPYIPKFLTLTSSYSYGYPIYEGVTCLNSVLFLVCPTNQFIHVYAAYFGIQSQTISSCLSSLTASSPANCFNKAVFNTINSSCEYQSNCSIVATASQLGDPCYGNSKQLMVQYQCVDYNTAVILNQCPINTNTSSACPVLSDPSIQTQFWCEPSLMQITCTGGSVIQIMCAYYGIDSTYQCPGGNYIGAPTSCYSNSAKQLVNTRCNGKTSCSIIGNPNYQMSGFTDSCYGFSKLLYVQYKCVSPTALTTSTTSTSPTTTTTLPYCSNFIVPSGQCSSIATSPYVPTFATANQTSFGYPVMQQVVCLGSSVNLVCPANTVIHIYSAYFGIQSTTSVSTCFITSGEQPAMCYYPNSFSYINSTCEYQQTCLISANTVVFSDACPNYIQKQLLIQYQCVSSYGLNSTINQCNSVNSTAPLICPAVSSGVANSNSQTWCQGSTMNITCNTNQTINIICAYYGLHPALSSSCGISSLSPNIPVCYFKSSLTYVTTTCTNKTTCSMTVDSTNFADPCDGQTKGLYVQWSCV